MSGADDFDDIVLPDPAPAGGAAEDAQFGQADIDALFGGPSVEQTVRRGLRAVVESRTIVHERLPMLEVVCERTVRSFATAMRNLTSDAIDVHLENIATVRFGDFMNHVQLPAMIGVFRAAEWANYGLVVVDSALIYSVVDALLGGRKGMTGPMIDGRGFTSIETLLVSRMLDLLLADLSAAFEPVAAVSLALERVETNPRFAAIAGPSNIASAATFRIDMDGRGGPLTVLLPAATLEPVKGRLVQRFMGEAGGSDSNWRGHMETEMRGAEVEIAAVLGETALSLAGISALAPGDTLALGVPPDQPITLDCGGHRLARVHIGQRRSNIAVALAGALNQEPRR